MVQVQSAELTLNGKTYDVTIASGTSTPPWEAILPGTKSWKLKITGPYDIANDPVQATLNSNFASGTVNAITVSPNAGTNNFTGNAYLDGPAYKFDMSGAEMATWSFTGTGALSYA